VRESTTSSSFDLRSTYTDIIPTNGTRFIKTDLQADIPNGFYAQITSCSQLPLQHYIDIIHEQYTCNLAVILFNHSNNPFVIWHGGSVGKFPLHKFHYPALEEEDRLEPS
jgi:dUTPase